MDSTTIPYGQTALVVVMDPAVNAMNTVAVPQPDTARAGVTAAVLQGVSGVTEAAGLATLSRVTPGERTISFRLAEASGASVIAPKDLLGIFRPPPTDDVDAQEDGRRG